MVSLDSPDFTTFLFRPQNRCQKNVLEQLAKVLGIHTGSEVADNVLFDIIKSHLSAVLTTCIDETDDEGTDPSLVKTV